MTIEQITQKALSLSKDLKLQLIDTLLNSLESKPAGSSQNQRIQEVQQQRDNLRHSLNQSKTQDIQASESIVTQLIGIAKTDSPPPTNEEVAAMLDERLVQKYL